MARFSHLPVLLKETVDGLAVQPGGRYIDGTLGGAGHTEALLAAGAGAVLGIDRDPAALAAAHERLRPAGASGDTKVVLAHGNFRDLAAIAQAHGFEQVDGVLLDIGVSSHQLDVAERGFSFAVDAPLDMRMDPTGGMTAADLVNDVPENELADLIYNYGEERASRRIARLIAERRRTARITTTVELANIVKQAIRDKSMRIHPATRTFQALRIAVNDELGALETVLPQAIELLAAGGRLAVITFHSLEDRIVKQFMLRQTSACLLPPRTFAEACPHLVEQSSGPRPCIYLNRRNCDYSPQLSVVTIKPVTASAVEVEANPRSRSAKLRVAARLIETAAVAQSTVSVR